MRLSPDSPVEREKEKRVEC